MASDRDAIKDVVTKYFALFIFQCIITIGLLVCPTISIIHTAWEDLKPGHVYALAALTLIQAVMSGLTYQFGKKISPGETHNKKCGCFITVGIFVGFPEFALIFVIFVIVGIFIGDDPDQTNERLAYAILIFTGLALLANILTIYMGCALGPALGVNFKDTNRRVEPERGGVTGQGGGATGQSHNLHLFIHGDQTAHVRELQIQNSLLQQQLLLQQQQQLNEQQRRNRAGFDPLSPAPGYSEDPPPYSSVAHTPSHIK